MVLISSVVLNFFTTNTVIHNAIKITAVIIPTPTHDPVIIPCWNDSPCELLSSEVCAVSPSSSTELENPMCNIYIYIYIYIY